MQRGSEVVYKKDPSFYDGPMTVTEVRKDGLIECVSVATEEVHGPFQPHELDDAKDYYREPVTS